MVQLSARRVLRLKNCLETKIWAGLQKKLHSFEKMMISENIFKEKNKEKEREREGGN